MNAVTVSKPLPARTHRDEREAFEDYQYAVARRDYIIVLDDVYAEKCPQYSKPMSVTQPEPEPQPVAITTKTLTAGTCEVTFRRKADGKQHSFRIRRVCDNAERGPMFFLDYNADQTGRLNDWQYMGLFRPDAIHEEDSVRLTTRSRYDDAALPTRVARHYLIQILYGTPICEDIAVEWSLEEAVVS